MAAGWPIWLDTVVDEAIHGWVPLRSKIYFIIENLRHPNKNLKNAVNFDGNHPCNHTLHTYCLYLNILSHILVFVLSLEK
ncbi:hypothetical protein L2E82_15975 [Cichorium intybus]|uniref:Uncharacterized protein n=1 Tax=Cichorium intybus TaxID=13427 RepID=A0ACB9F4V7_CICIN|nr:hypothetical protein L2E82_15975 [Cichorium intybus]